MALNAIVAAARPASHGFDCNTPVSAAKAGQFRAAGFAFAVRYLSRGASQGAGDLSTTEAQRLLGAGLALMAAQHVAPSGWVPTEALGTTNGKNAAKNASDIGLLAGVSVWLDVEGVNHSTPVADVLAYCNAWFKEVEGAGFTTGIYVGANAILSGDDLFFRLRTKHYWKSGSTVPDIPHRGYQMVQTIAPGDTVAGIEIDRNVTKTDAFGDAVQWMIAP
jgi:hypothetical protein